MEYVSTPPVRANSPQRALLPTEGLEEFCRRWRVRLLELYGSAARGELRRDSDLDFLVSFEPGADWSLFDHVRMKRELEALTGRSVDLTTRRALERSRNHLLRDEILGSAQPVYAAESSSNVAR